MQKRIFVTGAAGFIGFHVAKACLERGFSVAACDNFSEYYSVQLKRDRAKALKSLGLDVKRLDIADKEALFACIAEFKPTHIINLAAQAGVRYSLDHPKAYVTSNIEGFLNVLEACRQMPGVVLVYASSSSVYGHNDKIPFSVDDRTDSPANFYAVTKKCNELMAYAYHSLYGIPAIGLRFFTVYGPWGRPDMAYFSFTKAIFEGGQVDVYNEGVSQRDFTYIDDVVVGVINALDYPHHPAIFNLGNHHPESVNTLIALIEKKAGLKLKTRMLPLQPGEVLETYADIEYSQKELRFFPKTSLEEGMERFIDWYRSYSCIK
jgi:UDP-glucuronate 4-epimerase